MKQLHHISILLVFLLIVGSSCQPWVPYAGKKKLALPIVRSSIFEKGSTGFALYDLEKEKLLVAVNGEKRFTPASNTKLLTTLVALQTFGKSLPVIDYVVRNDSLLLYPTGFPGFGYINDTGMASLDSLIRSMALPTKLMLPKAAILPYGAGWAWDDVGYYFQAPRAVLPLFGNLLERKKGTADQFMVGNRVLQSPSLSHPTNASIASFISPSTRFVPFYPDQGFIKKYFTTTGEITVAYENIGNENVGKRKSILQSATPFYKAILEDSDNFVAEQLLLMIAKHKFDTWDISVATKHYNEQLLIRKNLAWVDGSGLSRYNAISPLQLVEIIQALLSVTDKNYIQEILPAAGREGSIRNSYKGLTDQVFAKTGTLRHVHCLSGLLTASSGKKLIFSFMHNQIPGSNQDWKMEMDRLLQEWHQAF